MNTIDKITARQEELQKLWKREVVLVKELRDLWDVQLERTNGATDVKGESTSHCLKQPDALVAETPPSVDY